MTDAIAASPLAHAMGVALVHFLWQGALLGAACGLLLAIYRRGSAQARYLIGCGTLAVMVIVVAATVATYFERFSAERQAFASAAQPSSVAGAGIETQVAEASSDPRSVSSAIAWIEARWQVAVVIWLGGVVMLSLHLLRGWLLVVRVRRSRAEPLPAIWLARVHQLAASFGIKRRLQALESAWVEAPGVIGWLRPIVLVPASALAGLTPAQFEAILIHELAHVQRQDYLVNLLQSVVEVLLFYHPAVWWVSRRVRLEREHCCDDLAVQVCGDRETYAGALATLEEARDTGVALSMSARGGDLLPRVRRVLARQSSTRPSSGWVAVGVTLAIAVVVHGANVQNAAVTKPPTRTAAAQDPANLTTPATGVPLQDVAIAPPPTHSQRGGSPPPPRDPQPRVVPGGTRTDEVAGTDGAISGTVVDQQGGRLPGAAISVTSVDATQSEQGVTNAAGRYTIANLAPGIYDVRVSLPGFKTSRNILQVVNTEKQLNVQLEVGSISETIYTRAPATTTFGPVAAPPVPGQEAKPAPRTPLEYFDLAKQAYQQGRTAEAETLTLRAAELLRDQRALELMRAQLQSPNIDIAPQDAPNAPIRIGGAIKEPRKIHDVKPIYPQIAIDAGVQGIVILEAIIARDGTVRDAKILRSVPLLDQAALDAVRQWGFTPTLLNGVPLEVIMTVTVNFAAQ